MRVRQACPTLVQKRLLSESELAWFGHESRSNYSAYRRLLSEFRIRTRVVFGQQSCRDSVHSPLLIFADVCPKTALAKGRQCTIYWSDTIAKFLVCGYLYFYLWAECCSTNCLRADFEIQCIQVTVVRRRLLSEYDSCPNPKFRQQSAICTIVRTRLMSEHRQWFNAVCAESRNLLFAA